jgi:ribosome-associated heat shock protein Hsp15
VADGLRLDKFLWFARIVKTRALAQQLAQQGRLRIAGRVVDRAHAPVRPGDVLSFALRGRIRVIRVEQLPTRRGSPAQARETYCEIGPDEPAVGEAGNAAGDAGSEPLTSEGGGD